MLTPQYRMDLGEELCVDLFAGGGGMSSAIEQAIGRHVDVAVNHSADAISMHEVNHPQTNHYRGDVFEVCPRAVCNGRPVGLLHLSPDCTHHSQAAGGQPRNRRIRSLSWIGKRWAGQVAPRVITLENVKQILQWGPLVAKRDKTTGRVIKLDGTIAATGERVPIKNQFLVPDPRRTGQTWQAFVRQLRGMGYTVEWRVLCAADFGAPTTRERLFMVARRDGSPVLWPEPTHTRIRTRGKKRWRAASECIDWTIPCPSIFARNKPLAEATLRRIAKGLYRYVLNQADPFVIPVTHQGGDRCHGIREPLRTITAAHRGELALIAPYLAQMNGGFNETPGHDMSRPMTTITHTGSQQQLVTAHLACFAPGMDKTEERALRVAAFLMRYYGEGGQWGDLRDPMATITTKDRLALVTVTLNETPYAIVDIGLRMLQPRELYRAQGFPNNYIIDRGHDGRLFSKSAQVRMCGNSVPPPLGAAIIAANYADNRGRMVA